MRGSKTSQTCAHVSQAGGDVPYTHRQAQEYEVESSHRPVSWCECNLKHLQHMVQLTLPS